MIMITIRQQSFQIDIRHRQGQLTACKHVYHKIVTSLYAPRHRERERERERERQRQRQRDRDRDRQTDRQTDGQTDRAGSSYSSSSYTPAAEFVVGGAG